MKRKSQLDGVLGPLESEVMEAVWDHGDATVRDVHATLARRRRIAYTTVMTTMGRLAGKGLLTRDTSGVAHRYRAALSRDDYAQTTVHSVVDWLVRSFPEPAISYFVEMVSDGSDPTMMDALRSKIDELRAQEG